MKNIIIAFVIFFNLTTQSQTVTWTKERVDSSYIAIKKDCPHRKTVQYQKVITVRNTSPVDIGYTHRIETFTVTIDIGNNVQTYSASNHTYSYQVNPKAMATITVNGFKGVCK